MVEIKSGIEEREGPLTWRFHRDLEGGAMLATCEWLRANGLNPDRVPIGATYTIDGDQLTYDHELIGYGPRTVPLLQPLPEPFASNPGGLHVIRPPWRFDVPAIPAHVTAILDGDGDLYVRHADNPDRWSRWLAALGDHARISVSSKGLLFSLPLEQAADPRKDGQP